MLLSTLYTKSILLNLIIWLRPPFPSNVLTWYVMTAWWPCHMRCRSVYTWMVRCAPSRAQSAVALSASRHKISFPPKVCQFGAKNVKSSRQKCGLHNNLKQLWESDTIKRFRKTKCCNLVINILKFLKNCAENWFYDVCLEIFIAVFTGYRFLRWVDHFMEPQVLFSLKCFLNR